MPKFKIGDVVIGVDSVYAERGEGEVIDYIGEYPEVRFECGRSTIFCEDELRLVARPVEKETEQAIDEALGLVLVQMRIPVELHEALKAIAEGKGWVLPAVMREALSLYAYK